MTSIFMRLRPSLKLRLLALRTLVRYREIRGFWTQVRHRFSRFLEIVQRLTLEVVLVRGPLGRGSVGGSLSWFRQLSAQLMRP